MVNVNLGLKLLMRFFFQTRTKFSISIIQIWNCRSAMIKQVKSFNCMENGKYDEMAPKRTVKTRGVL